MFNEIITFSFLLFAIYGLTTTAGVISERSGIVNIGLNGNVIAGALGSLMFHGWMSRGTFLHGFDTDPSFGVDLVALIVSGIFGVIVSFVFSIATVTLKGDHVIVGTAVNILMAALAFVFLFLDKSRSFSTPDYSGSVLISTTKVIHGFDYRDLVYFFIAIALMAIMWFMIRYTKFGLRMWASGENPLALAAAGVSVLRIRYQAQIIVGFISGVAGGIYMKYTLGNFNGGVEGIGFIAMALLVISQWRIHWVVLVAFVFAVIQSTLKAYNITLQNHNVPVEYVRAIPFAIPIIVLPFFSKVSKMPKFDGQIYDPSQR